MKSRSNEDVNMAEVLQRYQGLGQDWGSAVAGSKRIHRERQLAVEISWAGRAGRKS